jgi:hypothetical protein
MADLLSTFLRQGGAHPFVWGELDCCLWPSDWVRLRRGIDPAASLRGRYRTALGARRHIARAGGWEALTRRLAEQAGLSETDTPNAGDIGLVESEQGPMLAIRTATGWACKGLRSIVVAPFKPIVAWSV